MTHLLSVTTQASRHTNQSKMPLPSIICEIEQKELDSIVKTIYLYNIIKNNKWWRKRFHSQVKLRLGNKKN